MSERSKDKSPSKPVFSTNYLVTPSASPPSSRIRGTAPPPAKKPRFGSTASSSSFSASTPRSSSLARFDLIPDIHDARRASSMRVLDIWSSLAARYSKPIDEDDIIDLRTGSVVKDRGVLRALPGEVEVGHFADTHESLNLPETSSGAQTEAEDEESVGNAVDDEVDEIDAFATAKTGLRLEPKPIKPVQVANPADLDDLREFMEAEAQRKKAVGEEDEDESSDDELEIPADSDLELSSIGQARDGSPLLAPDDDSDDEFGAWAIDEGSTVYQVEPEGDIDAELGDLSFQFFPSPPSPLPPSPTIPIPSPQPQGVSKPKRKAAKLAQAPEKLPDINSDVLELSSSPLPPSSLPSSPTPPNFQGSPKVKEKPIQLLTPPRSSSVAAPVHDRSLDDIDLYFPPPTVKARSKSAKPKAGSDSDLPSSPEVVKIKRKSAKKQKMVPEVVLPMMTPNTKKGYTSFGTKPSMETVTRQSKSTKPLTEFQEGSSTLQTRVPLTKAKPKKKASKPTPQSSSEEDLPPARTNKRKRSVSPISEDDRAVASGASSEDSDSDQKTRSNSRSKSRATTRDLDPHPYPYSIPYTSQPHPGPYPTFQPIQDPNAQYMIAQAMQQLAYMMTGAPPPNRWPAPPMQRPGYPPFPPPPLTPSHHRFESGPSSSGYDTPGHHSHPYPYMYDPSHSRATLPPSSPLEVSSSPMKGKRSKSHSRQVSFKLDRPDSPPSPPQSKAKTKGTMRGSSSVRKERSSAKAIESSDGEVELISSPSKPPKAVRGRTPGPRVR